MDFIAIPADALNSKEYESLTLSDKNFLVELYRLYGDCERFLIDTDKPEQYRQPKGSRLVRKVNKLLSSGLLRAVDLHKNGNNHYQRIFVFRYPAIEAFESAA